MKTRVSFEVVIDNENDDDYVSKTQEIEMTIKQCVGVEDVSVGIGEDESEDEV